MTFRTVARNYLAALQALFDDAESSQQLTPELSYHPTLDKFLRDVAQLIDPDIVVVFEPKKQSSAGHPDWRFHNSRSLGVYGYAEAKGPQRTESFSAAEHQQQVDRYLKLGHQLILTDGLEFVFYSPAGNQDPKRLSLVPKPVEAPNWRLLDPNPFLEAKLRQFFRDPGSRTCTEERLIEDVARRALELSNSVMQLADLPAGAGLNDLENRTIETLHQLKAILEKHHDPRLRDRKAFADFVAQVLVFGLLYAHRIIAAPGQTPADRYRKIKKFWSEVVYSEFTDRLRPFRALIELLGNELHSLGPLGVWYQDCALLLAHVQLRADQTHSPDYHKLYEHFLAVFDPQTRFDFGAFYTPRELACFTVKLTQAIVDSNLPNVSLYEPGNKLIDPTCGTGTFIEQLILQSDRSHLPNIIGFEILPAPYALAHYRLAMLRDHCRHLRNLSIILTNTLSDDLEMECGAAPFPNLMQQEQAAARELSKPPLTLVIGNPPSSDSQHQAQAENQAIIHDLLEDFRPPPQKRSDRQNIQKQISQNEFVKFLRWTTHKLLQSRPGIFALILPSSFAEHPTYLYARKWLASHFPELWILDLDLDARTGIRASSLFNTLQGRLLLVGFTGLSHTLLEAQQVHYASIADLTKQDKLRELTLERDPAGYLEIFDPLPLTTPTCDFRPPKKPFDKETYSRYWPLYPEGKHPRDRERYVFHRHCSGVKLAPSSMFVHASKPHLLRRTRDIANSDIDLQELKRRWFSGQDRPPSDSKFSEAIRTQIAATLKETEKEAILWYAYRPLTVLPAFISEPVLRRLAQTGGGGTRYRPEVLSAFQAEDTIGIAVAPAPKDIGERLHRFASFCWNLPDNDLCKRGNAHIFCNRFPEYKKRTADWNPTPVNNISPELLERLATVVETSSEEVVYYAYGILCSDLFLDQFEGALFTVADPKKRPRIPIPADPQLFKSIAEKGKRLARLEKPPAATPALDEFAAFEDLFPGPFRLTSFNIDANTEKIELLKDKKLAVAIAPVPREILGFAISGYTVLQQWLKIHTYRYTRTQLNRQQYLHLLDLLHRIALQVDIIRKIDQDVSRVLSGDVELL